MVENTVTTNPIETFIHSVQAAMEQLAQDTEINSPEWRAAMPIRACMDNLASRFQVSRFLDRKD